jgi:metal-responsive CopG/Arc/MetJ family transcriptional regulator
VVSIPAGRPRKTSGKMEKERFYLDEECSQFLDLFRNRSEIVREALREKMLGTSMSDEIERSLIEIRERRQSVEQTLLKLKHEEESLTSKLNNYRNATEIIRDQTTESRLQLLEKLNNVVRGSKNVTDTHILNWLDGHGEEVSNAGFKKNEEAMECFKEWSKKQHDDKQGTGERKPKSQ